MSKPNKANRNNYTQAGRLTPDQMGRERIKQGRPEVGRASERIKGGAPGESRRRAEPESSPDQSEREEEE
jgi:hypothetical protein